MGAQVITQQNVIQYILQGVHDRDDTELEDVIFVFTSPSQY